MIIVRGLIVGWWCDGEWVGKVEIRHPPHWTFFCAFEFEQNQKRNILKINLFLKIDGSKKVMYLILSLFKQAQKYGWQSYVWTSTLVQKPISLQLVPFRALLVPATPNVLGIKIRFFFLWHLPSFLLIAIQYTLTTERERSRKRELSFHDHRQTGIFGWLSSPSFSLFVGYKITEELHNTHLYVADKFTVHKLFSQAHDCIWHLSSKRNIKF